MTQIGQKISNSNLVLKTAYMRLSEAKQEVYSQHDSLHKKWRFLLQISSVNVTKSAVPCGFSHIYWRNPLWKTSFFVQWFFFLLFFYMIMINIILLLVIMFSDLPLFLEPLLFVAFFSIFQWFAIVSYFHCSYENHYCYFFHYYLYPFFLFFDFFIFCFFFFFSRIKWSRLASRFFFLLVCFFVLLLELKSQDKDLQPYHFFLGLKKITV